MLVEDLTVFFNTSEFAQVATLNGVAVTGIFDNAYTLGSVGPAGMASTQPTLTLPTTAVPTQPIGLTCAVGGISYVVAAHEPDGTGISLLMLERSA